jgi:hypothetical protein
MIARLQSWIMALSDFERDLEDQGWIIAYGGDFGFVCRRTQQNRHLSP